MDVITYWYFPRHNWLVYVLFSLVVAYERVIKVVSSIIMIGKIILGVVSSTIVAGREVIRARDSILAPVH